MDLSIFQSSKGTKVVLASNLYEVLQLPVHLYNSQIKNWLSDVYNFEDEIRPAQLLKDYSEKKNQLSKRKDYYLSLELAGMITLRSQSPVKLKLARLIHKWQKNGALTKNKFTKDQVIAVLELTKVMGLVSCQEAIEQKLQTALFSNPDQYRKWWRFRAGLLGYTVNELQEKMIQIGQSYKGKNLKQMLLKVDKYEIVRMAVIELFMALGNSKAYATDMGDMAKVFAKEIGVEIRDDRKDSLVLTPQRANPELIKQLRAFSRQGTLAL